MVRDRDCTLNINSDDIFLFVLAGFCLNEFTIQHIQAHRALNLILPVFYESNSYDLVSHPINAVSHYVVLVLILTNQVKKSIKDIHEGR